MEIKNKRDFYVGIVCLLFAVIMFCLMPFQIGSVKNTWGVRQTLPLGQRLFPVISLAMVAVSGIILALNSVKYESKKPYKKKENEDFKGFVVTVLLWVAYAVGTSTIGYIVSTLIIVLVLLRYYGVKSWITTSAVTVGITLFVFIVFDRVMQLPFPSRVLLF